jgi:drug/metabolite transporter (DMT)-like permease
MSSLSLALLAAIVVGMSSGQILFKVVGGTLRDSGVMGLLTAPLFYVAGALYAGVTLLWILLLSREPLSQVYPATALVYVIVPAAGVLLFHEPLSLRLVGGIALIIGGVALVSLPEAAGK